MIHINGTISAIATANASPAVPDWVDTISADYPIGPLTYLPGFDITLGTLFQTTAGGSCTGIRMRLGTINGANPNYIHFALFAATGPSPPISSEIIPFSPSMYGDIVQTTGMFVPAALSPATFYIAAAYINGSFGPYNYAADVSANPGYLPKSFTKYVIQVGSQSAAGGSGLQYPNSNNPQYANYIEPLIS